MERLHHLPLVTVWTDHASEARKIYLAYFTHIHFQKYKKVASKKIIFSATKMEQANQINRESAELLVQAGEIEVQAGIRTKNDWLRRGTEIDRDVALANQQATILEGNALLLMPSNPAQAARQMIEAANIRRDAVLKKYKAAQGLELMMKMHVFGRRSRRNVRTRKERTSRKARTSRKRN